MRVLIVSHEWEAISPGGAQRSASALARGLAQQPGIEVTLASAIRNVPPTERAHPWRNAHGFDEVLVRSETDLGFYSWQDPTFANDWQRVLTQVQPDVVHLHHYFHVGVELPLLVRHTLPGVPVVMTLHEFLAICLQSGQMLDSLGQLCSQSSPAACANCVDWPIARTATREDYVRRAFESVDLFVTPSRFVRDRYVDWGLDIGRVRVIANALDLERRVTRRTRALPANGLRLAFIGQHTPYKGLDVLMDAVLQLHESGREVVERLEVYGDGSDRFGREFETRISELRAREVGVTSFRGRYTQEDLPGILDGVDAIVVPSIWWENSPVVIEEALARRVPVICSDIGGMAEKVRDGIDGWHFEVGSPVSLAALLTDLSARTSLGLPLMRVPLETADVVQQHLDAYGEAARRRERTVDSDR
ncbi:MAG: glycosyltransferase family 4 protein [Actinomycetes bacterium]